VDDHPVFNEAKLDRSSAGIKKLEGMQNPDGGWGWFTDESSPHTTAVVVDGLKRGATAGAPVPPELLAKGMRWLFNYQSKELARMKLPVTDPGHKTTADSLDALVASIIEGDGAMLDAL